MRRWLLGLASAAIAISLVTTHGVQRQYLNADHIMYSIMSLDQVTLFYWGQNRFLSVIPFLASVIADPYFNLFAVTALSALSHLVCLALLYAVAHQLLFERSVSFRALAPAVLLLWGISFALLEPTAIYTMLQHHEYSLAISMLLGAWLLAMRSSSTTSIVARVVILGFAGVLILLALGVNPSIVVLGLALVLLQVLLRGDWRRRFAMILWLAALTAAFSIWYLIMNRQSDEQRYFSIRWNEIGQGFQRGISSFINQFEPIVALVLVMLLTWLAISAARRLQINVQPKLVRAVALTCGFAAAWVLGFSTIDWVFENDHHARYFLPATYLLLLLTSFALAGLLKASLKLQPRMLALLGLVLIGSLTFKAPLSNNLLDAPVFEAIPRVDSQALVLAGDYWEVWPQYFLLKAEGKVPVSLAYRSKAIAEYFRTELKQQLVATQPVSAWCMGSSSSHCERQLRSYLKDAVASDFLQINPRLQQFSITWDAN